MKIPTISTLFFSRYSEPSNQSLPKSIQPVKDVEKKQLLPSALREDLGSGCFLRNSSCLATQVLTPTKKKTSPLPLKSLLNPNESSRNKKKKGKLHDSISAPIFCGDKENGGFFHKGILNCHGLQGKKKTFLN